MFPKPLNTRFHHLSVLSGCLLLALAGTCAHASPTAKKGGDGVEVKVTPEMTGAGQVSSGVALPPIPPVTGSRSKPVASWGKPLPYPILIADRRNNRLIEVTPDKRIVWEFASPNLKVYRGNEDVNFSADGKLLAVSEEDNYDMHIVDYEKREHHLDLRHTRHPRQERRVAELPRRCAPAGRRQVPDSRHPQLPGADHRPGQQNRHAVGHTRQVQAQPTQASWRSPTAPRRWTTATSW
jgi:hypothetical protein